jgi:hypothetical protein
VSQKPGTAEHFHHLLVVTDSYQRRNLRKGEKPVEYRPVKTRSPFSCLLLSDMPGSGKDTLTHKLVARDPSFAFLSKHRADPSSRPPGEDNTSIPVAPETFWSFAQSGGFLQFYGRYGRMDGVSRQAYAALIDTARIPIMHVGKYENLKVL